MSAKPSTTVVHIDAWAKSVKDRNRDLIQALETIELLAATARDGSVNHREQLALAGEVAALALALGVDP